MKTNFFRTLLTCAAAFGALAPTVGACGGDNNGGQWDGRGRDDNGRNRGDWNDGRGRGDNNWNGGRGGGRDFTRNDWGRGRDDGRRDRDRYNRWHSNHIDWSRPRYSDWRSIRYGYYFDRGYSLIFSGFFGHNYYWYGYDGWRRPYRDWRVGYILPYDIYWEEIPYDLYYRLPPAPYGCRYILVGRDILLIVVSSGLVLDAMYYY